jgi:anti-sigma factor (TIGR02949 family)
VVQAHLQLCPPCLDRADFERHLRALVASRCREKAPPGLLERVLTVLQETRLSVPPRGFQSPAPDAGRG